MRKRTLKLIVGIGSAVVVAGGVAGVAGIAGADPTPKSTTFVDGFGDINDDWNDHEREAGVLCDGCDNSNDTDLVLLWQSVLTADGHLTVNDVDGDFGPVTAKATMAWQEANKLEPTGEVDQATWATADDHLGWDEGDVGSFVIYGEDGGGSVSFERTEGRDGGYQLRHVHHPNGKDELYNSTWTRYIELFDETIELKLVDDDDA